MKEIMMSIFNMQGDLKMIAYAAIATLMIVFGGSILCTPENETEKHKIQKYWFISMLLVLLQRVTYIVMASTIDTHNPAENMFKAVLMFRLDTGDPAKDMVGAVLISAFAVMDILLTVMTIAFVVATIVLTIRYQIKKRQAI